MQGEHEALHTQRRRQQVDVPCLAPQCRLLPLQRPCRVRIWCRHGRRCCLDNESMFWRGERITPRRNASRWYFRVGDERYEPPKCERHRARLGASGPWSHTAACLRSWRGLDGSPQALADDSRGLVPLSQYGQGHRQAQLAGDVAESLHYGRQGCSDRQCMPLHGPVGSPSLCCGDDVVFPGVAGPERAIGHRTARAVIEVAIRR
mmetsp:Transcript_69365/g.200969  ORF Transcript_69365/g.200969 Transcript_69365/m.200969 type:complete len:205 (+) Transcript_69365:1087-1701(+)